MLKKDLLRFFYQNKFQFQDGQEKQYSISVMDMLYQIALEKCTTKFSEEILKLFICIAKLDYTKNIFIKRQRFELYKNKIQLIHEDTTIKNLLQLIKICEDCMFTALVDVFNQLKASNDFVKEIILCMTNFRDNSLSTIAEIIGKNVSDSSRCLQACQVFNHVYKYCTFIDEASLLLKIVSVLIQCLKNEQAFGTMCDFIGNMQLKLLNNVDIKIKRGLVDVITRAFTQFKCPKVLMEIAQILKLLKVIASQLTKVALERTTQYFYEELIEIEALEIAEYQTNKSVAITLMKLTMLYESELDVLHDYFEYDTIFIINQRHLENIEDPNYFYYARFQTVLLKFSFKIISKNICEGKYLQYPITIEDIVRISSELRNCLLQVVELDGVFETVYDAKLILESILDLHHNIHVRPSVIEKSQRVLCVRQPKITNIHFNMIIDSIQQNISAYLYESTNVQEMFHFKPNDLCFLLQILASLVDFVKNYSYQINYTSAFRIIYFCFNPNLKSSILCFLKFLHMKSEFIKILALAIMNFVIEQETLKNFSIFVTIINSFLAEEEKLEIKFKVVKFVLKSLPALIKKIKSKADNRLVILKLITTFMVNFNKDEAFIVEYTTMAAVNELQLNKREKETLDEFRRIVRGTRSSN